MLSSLRYSVDRSKSILLAKNRAQQVMPINKTRISCAIQQLVSSHTFHLSNEKLHILDQQRHMGRKDGNKAFFKVRGPTRKKKKKYHKRMRELYHQKEGRHSKPGSKAGPRREYFRDEQKFLVDRALGKIPLEASTDEMEYDFGDALVDDLIGNSSHLTASPTPRPVYLGKQYDKHYVKVLGMMEEFHAHRKLKETTNNGESNALAPPLPTDKQISLLLRSYRDRNSSKSRPLGIVKALRHLLTDIRLPTAIFEGKTYAALMSCAASPTEARRIMQMMEDNGQSPDVYIYSILIDIHAKKGDFMGADEVLSQMKFEGIPPTLPSYTSLLAACYKVVNTGSMPQKIKAEAGTLAWDKWKEAIINGLEPDVMAYGSIIRIMAARGFPEKAINLIEEMYTKQVQPTTLIFSSALKAVARSHANALRFEGGYSKKNKRREKIAAHHGKMAKNIVVLAEQTNVDQDDGFVSALMLCAGTAGDIASAKAIYLASEVRKLEDMRTIGGANHLDMIRGKDQTEINHDIDTLSTGADLLELTESSNHIENKSKNLTELEQPKSYSPQLSYNPKKRRRDTRKLNALLIANANAVEKGGLGNLWAGRDNKGYLCESSLRMIQQRYVPKYIDKSIPGISGTDAGLAGMVWDDEDVNKMGKRLRRKKFQGLIEDQEDNTIDDLDPSLYKLFVEDEDILFDEEKKEREAEGEIQGAADQIIRFEGGKIAENDNSSSNTILNVKDSEMYDESADKTQDIIRNLKDIGTSDVDEKLFENMLDTDGFEEELLDEIIAGEEMSKEEKELFNEMMSDFNALEVEQFDEDASSEVESDDKEIAAVNSSPQTGGTVDTDIALPADADDLDLVLYGMPASRINRVREEFERNLGTPSMIQIVPILRENMPELISRDWLIDKNIRDAKSVMEMAKDDKIVDSHLMNSMLQVYAKSNKVDEALDFYKNEFGAMKKKTNSFSDRTVFQMLIDRKDITRALDFKENQVEARGKKLDLLSYGSLIEHYGNRGQVGSAMIALKECVDIHGSPPGERSVSKLRLECRKRDITEKVGLEQLIGEDPLQWLRKGQSQYKREYSKRGNRELLMTKNRLLRI